MADLETWCFGPLLTRINGTLLGPFSVRLDLAGARATIFCPTRGKGMAKKQERIPAQLMPWIDAPGRGFGCPMPKFKWRASSG